jgi:hypothetical protein
MQKLTAVHVNVWTRRRPPDCAVKISIHARKLTPSCAASLLLSIPTSLPISRQHKILIVGF